MAKNERGAGRKKLPEGQCRERIVITLPPPLIERMDALDTSKSKIIEAALLEYLQKNIV